MQEELDAIIEQLRSDPPQTDAILEDLRTIRAYLQKESIKLAQQIPQQRGGSRFFYLLAGVGTLVTIVFDLGITAAVVAGLFGLAARSE